MLDRLPRRLFLVALACARAARVGAAPIRLLPPLRATPHVLGDGEACCICDADEVGSNCPCIPRDTNIFFVGDSLTRYQYIDLVYRLKFGKNHSWFRRQPFEPCVYSSWSEWQNISDARKAHMIGTHYELSPEERCDCHPGWPIYSGFNMENRYFHLPACNVNVSLITVFGATHAVHVHMRGEYGAEPPDWSGEVIGRLREFKARRQSMGVAKVLVEVVKRFHPHVLILNMGLWPVPQSFGWAEFARAAQRAAPCVVWKTTTRQTRPTRPAVLDGEALRHFAPFAGIFEAGQITEAMTYGWPNSLRYKDDAHFRQQSRVYHVLNNKLIRGLFPQQPRAYPPSEIPSPLRCPNGSFGFWGEDMRQLLAEHAATAHPGAVPAELAIAAAMSANRAALFERNWINRTADHERIRRHKEERVLPKAALKPSAL